MNELLASSAISKYILNYNVVLKIYSFNIFA